MAPKSNGPPRPPRGESSEQLLDRLPPQDLEAERCVLGSILALNDALDDVLQHVQSHQFYADAHRQMFQAMHDMYESGTRGIDAVTLGHELEKRGILQEVGGPGVILAVMQAVPHAAHAEYYAKIVREKWLQRSLIEACTDSSPGQNSGFTASRKSRRGWSGLASAKS
jgi:replicative DNA helicase